MNCAHCNGQLKVVSNKNGNSDPLKHRFYLYCTNCKSRGPLCNSPERAKKCYNGWIPEENKVNENQITLEELCNTK